MKCEILSKTDMETRSATRRRKSTRKPLSDCTNTHDSQHSSSSSVASTSIKRFTSSSPTIVSVAKPPKPQKSTAASSAALWGSRKGNDVYASSSTSVPSRGLNPSSSVHAFNKHQKLKTDGTTRDENCTSTSKPSRGLDVSSSVPAFNKPQKLTIQRSANNENIASTSTPSHGLDPSSSVPAFHEPQKPTTLRSTIKKTAVSASTSTSTPSRAPNPLSTIPGTKSEQSEIFTIYRRRQSADKRKGTCDPVVFPNFSCPDDAPNQLEKMNEVRVANQSTSTVPAQKKQRQKACKKEVKDSLLQDFVEKQKAYFAEIDAFELSEEEVASIDEFD